MAFGFNSNPAFINRTVGLLRFWGVDPEVVALIASMHSASWFQYGDLDTVICTHLGEGDQQCKLGALIFIGGYSTPLSIMHAELSAEGIALRLHEPSGAFWATPRRISRLILMSQTQLS